MLGGIKMETFEAQKTDIAKIFSDTKIIHGVPNYQRPYAWGEEQVNNLWEDLYDSENEYFLGTFVFNNEYLSLRNVKEIVDGQQRLLTLTIFFAVLRDIFLELKNKTRSDRIQSNLIANQDLDGKDNTYKFMPGKNLEDYFLNYIQKESTKIQESKPQTNEQKLVKKNYELLYNKIYKELENLNNNQERIKYLSKLRDKVISLELVLVSVNKEEDAFTFFETLNARGMQLSTSDIIKNLIFRKITEGKLLEESKIVQKWQHIVNNLTNIEEEADVTRFIRYYWLSVNKKVNEKKLFSEIKKNVEDYKLFLEELENESENYRGIIFPDRKNWENYQLNIYKSLQNINLLNVKQVNSLFLSLIRIINKPDFESKYKTKKIIEIFQKCEDFTFIYTTIAGKSPSPLESIYSKYAIQINSTKNKGKLEKCLNELLNDLKKRLPTKEEFIENFSNLNYKSTEKQINLLKYIFERINNKGKSETLLDHISIEHILPLNPVPEWNLNKDNIKEYVNCIGNLTILGPEYNRQAANKVIEEKIDYYEISSINITKELGKKLKENSRWRFDEIEKRGKKLAEIAWNLWNL